MLASNFSSMNDGIIYKNNSKFIKCDFKILKSPNVKKKFSKSLFNVDYSPVLVWICFVLYFNSSILKLELTLNYL